MTYNILELNLELNEYVLYLVENLKYLENKHTIKLNSLDETNGLKFELLKNEITKVIKITIDCRNTNIEKNKFNIFLYLFKRHKNIKLIVPSPALSFDLLIHLAINNQLQNLTKVKCNNLNCSYILK
jgi:hypothetical protein